MNPAGGDKQRAERAAYLTALCRAVPQHLVEGVLTDTTERSVGDRRFDGTVLFADLVGFTALCERLAASGSEGLSRLSAILDGLFAALLDDAMFPYGGNVVQFGGDSLTVVFSGEDQTRRAVAAALACERLMHGEVGRLLGGKSGELMLRIGLAAGPVSLPVLGDLHRRCVVAAGPTAHRAQRLQHEAQPNTILADAAIVTALAGNVDVVDRQPDRAVVRGLRQGPPVRQIPDFREVGEQHLEERIALLQPFVAQPLAGRMRSAPSGWRLEGELRSVVVLFAEVWGIEEAAQSAGTREAAANLARSLLRAYRKYDGIVAKVDLADRGHRIMVLFGLHLPAENDAERAILAGLEATTRLKGFTVANALEIGMRTGIHAGRVYFGAIGSRNRHDITVVGDTVNVAARCVAAAEAFEVVVTTPVLNAVAPEFEQSPRGPVRVKGKTSTISMHVVHGPSTGRAHYVRNRQQTRFFAGRDEQVAQLIKAVDEAFAGRGAVLGICGQAGTGKSALLSPIIDRWVAAGGEGVLGRCRFATRSTPLAPVVAMFENFLGITSRDTEDERRERIRQGLAAFDLHRGGPELVSLLQPVFRPDGTTEALIDLADPDARERVLGSIIEFLQQRIRRDPVLYVLENMHFADTLTLELAQRLTAIARDRRFLMLGTYRADPVLNDLRRGMDQELVLGNLGLHAATELIAHEVGAEAVDSDLAVFLWQRTEGNPGHMVEAIRFLSERQLLLTRGGMVMPPEPGVALLEDVVPRSLAQVALSRLDDLGAVERRLLRMASVIGRRFVRGLLANVADRELERELFEPALEALEDRRVIVSSAHDSQGYMFRDSVTRAVTYGTIPEAERRRIHARIADTLETLPDGNPRRTAAVLAMHRERAEQWLAASDWYYRAAQVAMRSALDREAADLVERWENVARKLSSAEAPSPRRRARMALLKMVATARQGMPARTLRLGRQIATEHWSVLDDAARGVVDYWLGHALVSFGQQDKARQRLERVYKSAARAPLRSDAAWLMAKTYEWARDFEQASAWLERAQATAGDDDYRLQRVDLVRANLAADQGDIAKAREVYARVKNATSRRDHLALAAAATTNLAYCDMLTGEYGRAIEGFEQAILLDRALRSWEHEANDLVNIGQCYIWSGQAAKARSVLERALSLATEIGDELVAAEAYVHLGAAVAFAQDPVEGTSLCDEGQRRAIRGGLREVEIAADLHLLRIAILRQDKESCRISLRRAETHGSHLTSLPLFSRVLDELRVDAQRLIDGAAS